MNIKIIEEALKDYKRKKSVVETALARIGTYEKSLNDPESYMCLIPNGKESGMPASQYKGTSSVEHTVLNREEEVNLLKEWIYEDKSRIYPYQIELEQIDGALAALNKQQCFIIEQKYFEGIFWRDIEIAFNDKFRGSNYITVSGIRKMNSEALETVGKILKPYFLRLKTEK